MARSPWIASVESESADVIVGLPFTHRARHPSPLLVDLWKRIDKTVEIGDYPSPFAF